MVVKFLKRVMLKKVAKRAVQLLIAFFVAYGIDSTLVQMGITIDWVLFEEFLVGFLFLIFEGVRNFLKVKLGWSWL